MTPKELQELNRIEASKKLLNRELQKLQRIKRNGPIQIVFCSDENGKNKREIWSSGTIAHLVPLNEIIEMALETTIGIVRDELKEAELELAKK